jgi:hypothetical protein
MIARVELMHVMIAHRKILAPGRVERQALAAATAASPDRKGSTSPQISPPAVPASKWYGKLIDVKKIAVRTVRHLDQRSSRTSYAVISTAKKIIATGRYTDLK